MQYTLEAASELQARRRALFVAFNVLPDRAALAEIDAEIEALTEVRWLEVGRDYRETSERCEDRTPVAGDIVGYSDMANNWQPCIVQRFDEASNGWWIHNQLTGALTHTRFGGPRWTFGDLRNVPAGSTL